MFDIITFGSASRDIFLKNKNLKTEKKVFSGEEGISLSLGSKIDIEDIYYYTGGGGTNTAVSFSNMGLKTAYCGAIGYDNVGEEVIKELKEKGVNISLVKKIKEKKTNQSVVLNVKDKDRTILVYRGASEEISKNILPLPSSKWLYLAPLSGKASSFFKELVSYAKRERIKVAVNPGNSQLSLLKIEETLRAVDILFLNQEEAEILTGISCKEEKKTIKKIYSFCKGIIVITKGPLGVIVFDGKYLYKAGVLKAKVVDRTGTGDAFGSGFVYEYFKSNDIVKSIQFATANSASILSYWGAKNGLLKKGNKFRKIKVQKNII